MTLIPRPRLWKYYLMLIVIHTIGRLPLGWRYGVARFVADRLYNHRRWIRENTRSNVRHVLGPDATDAEVDRIARQCARNTGRYYADVVGMHRMDAREFYEHDLVLEGVVLESAVELLNSPKLWQHLPKVLSPDAVDRLLAAPGPTDRFPLRDRALLAVLYATGCRASETTSLALVDPGGAYSELCFSSADRRGDQSPQLGGGPFET